MSFKSNYPVGIGLRSNPDFATILEISANQRLKFEELWLSEQVGKHFPAIARSVNRRQALMFCANYLAKHNVVTVRRIDKPHYLGLSIGGKIVADRDFGPKWRDE